MLWTVFAVLIVLWILGFAMEIGGGLIHILLVLALLAIVFNLFSGRRLV
ncbi:MAG: lmo0937 family membrane protein [Bacillota bacterium]